ncbi:MAG: extracellular solute-binding protein [Streptococcaceae bacterium]|jgi:arabinogalactan oligomer/maltooligosaccharide transport system substrate-binding protein|nr:extracellular solute-binding protein [Streptococcaceae bacterium]
MRKSFKNVIFGSVTLGLSVLALTACGSSKKESKAEKQDSQSLKLWVTSESKKFYETALEDFKKENPKLTVKVIETADATAQENVKKDPSAAADVFALPHDQLGQLVDSGVIQAIPEQYAKEIKSEQAENAVEGAEYKGKTYAFPYGIESQVLYYNKTKLSEADIATYESITSKATMGMSLKEVNAYDIAPLFMSVGDYLFGANGEDVKGTNWNNAKGVAVLEWIAQQKDNKGLVNTADDTLSKFKSGAIASFESGPWNKAKAIEAVGKDNLGVAVYPKINIGGEEVQQKAFLGVKLYAVNAVPSGEDTKRLANAYKLAAYLSGESVQELQFKDETRNIIPSNKNIQAAEYVTSDALANAVVQMSDPSYSVVMPKIPEMTNFWTASAAVLSDAYNGKIKADQYQAKLDQLVKDISGEK